MAKQFTTIKIPDPLAEDLREKKREENETYEELISKVL